MVPTDEAMITRQMLYSALPVPATRKLLAIKFLHVNAGFFLDPTFAAAGSQALDGLDTSLHDFSATTGLQQQHRILG
jgi:hypothetical protein